jgi:hypothetical protein
LKTEMSSYEKMLTGVNRVLAAARS